MQVDHDHRLQFISVLVVGGTEQDRTRLRAQIDAGWKNWLAKRPSTLREWSGGLLEGGTTWFRALSPDASPAEADAVLVIHRNGVQEELPAGVPQGVPTQIISMTTVELPLSAVVEALRALLPRVTVRDHR